MKAAIITVAGISSRFNEGIPEGNKKLKAIYYETYREKTLLFQLLRKCSFADRIVIVGGYKFDELTQYVDGLEPEFKDKISLVYNPHYEDLGSGYSLYLGLEEAFSQGAEEILFVEGDLDIDPESFAKVRDANGNVVTYTREPIYANKAVVFYQDGNGKAHYAFNSDHGLLKIDDAFSCILNSGQMWKFVNSEKLKEANRKFYREEPDGTNLKIIRNYLDMDETYELILLSRWTNCNTRKDFEKIESYWEDEQ